MLWRHRAHVDAVEDSQSVEPTLTLEDVGEGVWRPGNEGQGSTDHVRFGCRISRHEHAADTAALARLDGVRDHGSGLSELVHARYGRVPVAGVGQQRAKPVGVTSYPAGVEGLARSQLQLLDQPLGVDSCCRPDRLDSTPIFALATTVRSPSRISTLASNPPSSGSLITAESTTCASK